MGKHAALFLALIALVPAAVRAEEQYQFDPSEYESKAFEINGYVEGRGELFRLNRNSAFYQLNRPTGDQPTGNQRATGALEVTGKYHKDIATLNFTAHAFGQRDVLNGNNRDVRLYEGGLTVQPRTDLSFTAGKKVLKWGKGYAWNPVGFVERPKDPTDPDLSREGFWMATADYVRSFDGPVTTVGLTSVVLPTSSAINSTFGDNRHTAVAGKLYLLVADTDVDFMVLGGGARRARYGADFSRNIGSQLEVHGEIARVTDSHRTVLDQTGRAFQASGGATSFLAGMRYLSDSDTTYIVEYFHNGEGFTGDEGDAFFSLAHTGLEQYRDIGRSPLYQRARAVSPAYARQSAMRNYLNVKVSQNEAFGIVYFTPSLTVLSNIGDGSLLVLPELLYTGFHNVELRLRAQANIGRARTDYGEKEARGRVEIRVRYFF